MAWIRIGALSALTSAATLLAPAPLAAQRSAQATVMVRVEVLPGALIIPDSVTARRLAVAVPMPPSRPAPDTTVTVLPDRRRAIQLVFVGN